MCIPLDSQSLSLSWSPLSDNILFANEKRLIDLKNQTLTADYAKADSGFQIDQLVGYGRYLWSVEKQTPSAVIDLRTTVFTPTPAEPFGPADRPTIESAEFEYCDLTGGVRGPCQPILDITTNYPGVFVHDWQIATNNMLVWLAAESNSTEIPAISGVLPDQYVDTVLYMTDLSTLETREIFRLSELGIENVYSSALDWSPELIP